jgi:hypothetical protein
MRTALDTLARSNGDVVPYQLTVGFSRIIPRVSSQSRLLLKAAVPAGPDKRASLPVAQMDSALTYWNLMVRNVKFPFLPEG